MSKIVEGCCDRAGIAQLFASKHRALYTSMPFNSVDITQLLAEVDDTVSCETVFVDCIIQYKDV